MSIVLRFVYPIELAATFSSHHMAATLRWQDSQTQQSLETLAAKNLHCVQLDHCTLQFENPRDATLAQLLLCAGDYRLVAVD